MRPTSGRQTCDCCKDASSLEFGKIMEMKEVGVIVYRYLPQAQNEYQRSTGNGQVYIIQTTSGGDDVKLEELIMESEKKKISCPRCMKTIEHVKSLLRELPLANIREVTGICDHCYRKEFFNCPCCKMIVDKFLKFRMDETKQTEEERERNKSWLIKTQLSLKESYANVKDSKPEPRTRPKEQLIQESFTKLAHKQRIKNKSELLQEQKKYRLAEEDIEKELRIQMPVKESVSDTKLRKLIPRARLEGQVQEPELLQDKKKYRLAEEDMEKPPREQVTLRRYFSDMVDTGLKTRTRSEGQIQESQIPTSRYNRTPFQETAPFLKMYEKRRPKGKSELIHEQKEYKQAEEILEKPLRVLSFLDFPEEDIKPKPKEERTGILVSRDDGAPGGVIKPYETKKLPVSPRKQHSFETVMNSLSEPNVSNFSYSFPHEKIVIKKQMKRQISSSELIKNTQDMLHDREEAEKKKHAELKRLKEEKKRLADEEKIKLEEEKAIKDKEAELKEETEERVEITKGKKRDDIAATNVLKEEHKKQAKELSEEEIKREKNEKDMALGEKKAREAEKLIEAKYKQLTIEKKIKQEGPESEDGLKKGGKDQEDKSEKVDVKAKDREEKQQDLAAKSALKDLVAKPAKEKSEEETNKKQQEQVIALGEKKAKDAEKAIEDKQNQLTTEKKKKLSEVKEPDGKVDKGNKGDKGDKEKGKKLEKPAKEQKPKDDDVAAILKEQMAQKKQQELEKEKVRKEQQKERDLAEKKVKDLQTKKEETAPVIKLPILKPEVVSDEEDDVSVVILKTDEVTDIIKGQKIYKVKNNKRAEEKQPMLESKQAEALRQNEEDPEILNYAEQSAKKPKQSDDIRHKPAATSEKKSKPPDPEATKGVIRYTLSDRTFIDKGWTMLPTEKVVRKMNVYRMRPAKPEFDWFEHNKYKREMTYDSGEKLAEFDDNGRGRWYYRTGELALDYYDAEETNAGQRFVVYSTGQPDESGRSRPRTILATFDYSGNGIVFDHTGKIRLKYNQTEGVVLDRTIGPVSHWKWHTLNDPPVLQQVMIDTQMPYKDPTILKMGDKNADQKRPDNEEMIAIEFENFLKEKRQKLTQSFKPFQIKMKAMKINENFSLRVLDQASVYLLFRDGTTNLKINLGMVLDHKEIVDTDSAEIGEVSNTLDKLPACTDSIAGLQKAVAQAQAAERTRVRHERRLKRPEETASVDALRASCSRPPRTPILQASLTSCDKMTPKRFKPSCCALYYSTQLY